MGVVSGAKSSTNSSYVYHVCKSSGTFIPNFTGTVEYLIVGGGGGGGNVTSVGGQTGAISNNQILSFVQAVSSTNNITFDYVAASNNGYGQNFKVGDDAWIGDYNAANSIKIKGQQNPNQGYIAFGNSTLQLGQANNASLTFGKLSISSNLRVIVNIYYLRLP